ncbi:MAG: methyltransferase domain-containing protein [Pyrinomonadaceae bacterium]|nr:methyltransferase domain-containing protein [Pyrinomonadaceae bacterium]
MYLRLLDLLRCSECGGALDLTPLAAAATAYVDEISEGMLYCAQGHWFPVVRGIPRMLPDSLEEHWHTIKDCIREPVEEPLRHLMETRAESQRQIVYDRSTRQNFSFEWDNHELGGRTWRMMLNDRVEAFFKQPIRIPPEEMPSKILLDAGCGNGSQSVVYTALGLEVIAIDLSSGLEHGDKFRLLYEGAKPDKVHFVQADLQHPPLAPASVDIIHSAGVLHHTPDTLKTFRTLCPLLRADGTFYVWLYKYEQYSSMSNREAALALMDIFGAPYAHYHSYDEVAG